MRDGTLRRLLKGAVLADASFVIGNRGGGRFDISAIAWAAPVQYVTWVGGTVAGVAGARAIGDPGRWGLDVCFRSSISVSCCPNCSPCVSTWRRQRRAHGHRLALSKAGQRSSA